MIPAIRDIDPQQTLYLQFMEALASAGFDGEINPDYANRTVLATDNSIYQVLPQGVLYPKSTADLQAIGRLLQEQDFQSIVVSPRGGGTGTNGQSLTDGLIVDLSKHMNNILEINAEEGWCRVQTGVVKDQLNAALKPHGLFFAPELSTSNRATIGGMINTDASGQGSCVYGKTRDHVLALKTVLLDGSVWDSEPLDGDSLKTVKAGDSLAGRLHNLLDSIANDCAEQIKAVFPPLNRCLTGYDLAHLYREDGRFDFNSVLCGSEGTLGFISEAKLNVLPIPKASALVNVSYVDFNAALRDAEQLMAARPTSIETIDSKVLRLAQGDIIWQSVAEYFPEAGGKAVEGINLVEYTADSDAELQQALDGLRRHLQANPQSSRSGFTIAEGNAAVKQIWAMRKKAVGLLGKTAGAARPVAFVEDCCVPPQNLADFIAEFRGLLDARGLDYGMFGHVDAGVLHVRPILDMKDPTQLQAVREITDGVVKLTQKYHGLLWGEHGKGVRSEYAPEFFGDLYPQLQRIKAGFDPRNQLNPGKIATPDTNTDLLAIDAVNTRGAEDRLIASSAWQHYEEGMYCNGNGACYNWNPDDAMCPSWKATRQRIHSPKGRSSLLREWLKQLQRRNSDPVKASEQLQAKPFLLGLPSRLINSLQGQYDFNHEVHAAMSGCLACKSCVGQCPINVDVPEFRSKFFELYYGRYLRPLRHYAIGSLEFVLPWFTRMQTLFNGLMGMAPGRWLAKHVLGLVDSPLMSGIRLERAIQERGFHYADPQKIAALSEDDKARTVVLVQDAFTSHFETGLVLDSLELLRHLGFNPLLAPFKANGKPLHVHGFLKAFGKTASANAAMLRSFSDAGVELVGLDPSMTLSYRAEYRKVKALADSPVEVSLLQEWLAKHLDLLEQKQQQFEPGSYRLLAHCTEKTNAPAAPRQWADVFAALGLTLEQEAVGCCGMAGTYGHEAEQLETSKIIYSQSWQTKLAQDNRPTPLATGYSCRSQVKRFDRRTVLHPVQALLQSMSP